MSNVIGDRNLLFGIMALQKGIISREILVAAMKAWVADKPKGLAQILRELKALSENHHAVLEECVAEHLRNHGNDVQKSLAKVCLAGAARQDLEKITDPDVQPGLGRVSAQPIKEPAPKPKPAAVAAPVKVVKPEVQRTPPKPKREAPAKSSGVPTWVWV